MYEPHTASDRRRYVEEVRLSPPVLFEVEHPSEWGIALDDALKFRTKRLLDKDALMFEGLGPSVSIRLEVCSRVFLLLVSKDRIYDYFAVAGCIMVQTDTYQGLPEPSMSHHEGQAGQEHREMCSTLYQGTFDHHFITLHVLTVP